MEVQSIVIKPSPEVILRSTVHPIIQLPFIKMHGCGNDYVFLDCFETPAPADPGKLAITVSDRHRGIGSDGLVLMLPPDLAGSTARMQMFNADGTEGSLCGNALRCMAMWLHQTKRGQDSCRIAMADRLITAKIVCSDADNRSAIVRVRIGVPLRSDPSAVDRNAFVRQVTLADMGLPKMRVPCQHVSMGNPHTVLFLDSLHGCDVQGLGGRIEHHAEFPQRTNVEFVEVTGPASATVRVWERGSGETQACGSGACAVAVAGIVTGLFDSATPVAIRMLGGRLSVQWDDDNVVHLEGPAQEAYRGTVRIDAAGLNCEPAT